MLVTGGAAAEGPALRADFGELKSKLDAAVKSGKGDDFEAAMKAYDVWDFSGIERDDPELNANVARILTKLIAAATAGNRAVDAADKLKLKNAVGKAAADATIKAQLKKEGLTTGDKQLDGEIDRALA